MIAATRVTGRSAASVVLLEQHAAGEAPMAAVVHQRIGSGQVFAVLTDGLWRWNLRPQSRQSDEPALALFWPRAIHWLASGGEFLPGREVSVELDATTAEPDQPVRVTVATRLLDDTAPPAVELIAPDGSATSLDLQSQPGASGRYQGSFVPREPGVYRVRTRSGDTDAPLHAEAAVAVHDRSRETIDTTARADVMEKIAEASGGQCLALDDPEPLIAHLRGLRAARRFEPRYEFDFAQPAAFAIIAGCLGLEWIVRRRLGLP